MHVTCFVKTLNNKQIINRLKRGVKEIFFGKTIGEYI